MTPEEFEFVEAMGQEFKRLEWSDVPNSILACHVLLVFIFLII
jgi:hypothetical protein